MWQTGLDKRSFYGMTSQAAAATALDMMRASAELAADIMDSKTADQTDSRADVNETFSDSANSQMGWMNSSDHVTYQQKDDDAATRSIISLSQLISFHP